MQLISSHQLLRRSKAHQQKQVPPPPDSEQGIALVMALLLGFLLISGASALLVRKLVERKVGALTSYQQMAENAAISGFNRILSQLNNPTRTQYKGYLYRIDNNSDSGYQWENVNDANNSNLIELEEICTPTTASYELPTHPEDGKVWPVDLVPLQYDALENTLRKDGSTQALAYYRLRGFDSNFSDDQASGIFSIESLIKRTDPSNNKEIILARTLLTRSLDIKFVVANPEDWSVINAAKFEDINLLRIQGEGIIGFNVDQYWDKNCDQGSLEQQIGSTVIGETSPLIWPIRERGIPGPVLYEKNRIDDQGEDKIRIWSFSDSSLINRGSNCTEIACVRGEDWNNNIDDYRNASDNNLINKESNTITIKSDQICKGSDAESPCHLQIEYLNLSKTRLLIENSSRPIVIHLLSPNTTTPIPSQISSGSLQLSGSSQFCGVDVGSSNCNEKSERFIITNGRDDGDYANLCDASHGVLEFGGSRLPAAWIGLQSGTVKLNSDAITRGILWSQNICGGGHSLTLSTYTKSNNELAVIDEAEKIWNWRKDKLWGGNGRQTIRGIRGSGMDLFEKF